MSNEYQPQFDHDLAQAAQPTGVDGETVEPTNDPANSLNRGLLTLYENYLHSIEKQRETGLIDRDKADELAATVLDLAEKDGLKEKIKFTLVERAKEIMGSGLFFGPKEVKKAFGIEITEKLPIIPFNQEELIRAKELGQFLVLRVSQTADGQPMTMEKIEQLILPAFEGINNGIVMHSTFEGREEKYFKTDSLKFEWALTTRKEIPDSTSKNYLEQTEVLVEYLRDHVFSGIQMPKEFSDAIAEFEACKEDIRPVIRTDGAHQAQRLSELSISQLIRLSPVEMLYDVLLYYQNTGEVIPDYSFTNVQASNSTLVCFGMGPFIGGGVACNSHFPSFAFNGLGAMFSRNK